MKSLYHLRITLALKGPVLTKSTNPASFGLDAVVARDFRTDRPMLPGTLIEGRVREALHQLGETCRLDELFGRQTFDASSNEPLRGRLMVDDLLATTDGSPNQSTSRIAIDFVLGSAKGEALRVIETPFRPGEPVEFTGLARVFCADDQEAEEIARLLRLGLAWQVQFGAQRTTGFGRSETVAVKAMKAPDRQPPSLPTAPIALDLAIQPEGPLCIARHKIGDNLFESDDLIPGNMLAGAIKQTANALGVNIPEFDSLRFRHAFPTQGSQRPRALPLSTVRAGKKPLYDIANQRDPVLLKDEQGQFVAPAFPLDWKEHGDALGKLEWAKPARELRVRTAIDSVKRTADRGVKGDEGALFAWEMVHPFADGGDKTPIIWRTRIDLSKVTNKKATADALVSVLVWLGFVSKTKAFCEVLAKPVLKPEEAPELKTDEPLFLVLQTPALLADPRFQENPGVPPHGALTGAEMLALYRAVWNELSSDSLVLSHHFAQQHLAGGNHLYHYFQKNKKADQPYDPWLLTDAGSVFVFTVKDVKAQAKLAAWLTGGLPLPGWAKQRFGDHWQHNPYRPENGFGEVAVHVSPFPRPEFRPISLANPILPTLP